MAKEKKYYLIKEWFPERGQTSEKPAYVYYANKFYDYPITEAVRAMDTYSSRIRAERVAMKRAGYAMTEVIEVPEEYIREV